MIRDVFYFGNKPNAHPRERFAKDYQEAKRLATTEHFWIINEHCDYRDFDWDFDYELLPDEDVWARDFINVWPSQWQKDSGTRLCSSTKVEVEYTIYRSDVTPVKKKINKDFWIVNYEIVEDSFDFSWHPDPTDPPYIYVWGNQHWGPEIMSTIEYHVPNATQCRYMFDQTPKLPARPDKFKVHEKITGFDFSWVPNPKSVPYNYIWGNKWVPAEMRPTVEYLMEDATLNSYMMKLVDLLPSDYWIEHDLIDKENFDFSWRPDPREPAWIYVWGNKWIPGELRPTLEYHVPGATQVKYMSEPVPLLPDDNWIEVLEVDKSNFDMSWRPDPREPAWIYVWGNKWIEAELQPTLVYHVPGATETKYMSEPVPILPDNNWVEHQKIDKTKFDMSWRPDPREPAYIYIWGNKWVPPELQPTLEYHVPGATEIKYMTDLIPLVPDYTKWTILDKVDTNSTEFDFTWMPDPREPAYIYVWGNKWVSPELRATLEYRVPGATEIKYMTDIVPLLPDYNKWTMLDKVDTNSTEFDFTWMPDPREPSYIYVWGSKWINPEMVPVLEYHMEGATERKYMNEHVPLLPDDNWVEHQPIDRTKFDMSFRPDPREPAWIYVWGNQWVKGEVEPTLEYRVPGATERKFMPEIVTVLPSQKNFKTLLDVESFDYSWRPHPGSPPYIYVFGNEWNNCYDEQTVLYEVPGATEYSYVEDVIAKLKPHPELKEWETLIPIKYFDYSWRPNPNDKPYIYMFGNKWNDSEIEPTIVYQMEGATEYKFIKYPVAIPETVMDNWKVSENNEYKNFDYSWRPHPLTAPMIYVWENDGPVYTVPGAKDTIQMKNDTKYHITVLETKDEYKSMYWNKDIEPTIVDEPIHQKYQTMFYVDRGNSESLYRFEQLKQRYPMIQKTRFLNTWVDTISRCVNKADTPLFWVLNSELDYTEFNFDFTPNPWQMKMVHVFGTQWSHWGNTYLINRDTFNEDTKYVKVIEHLNVLNFVRDKKAKATNCLYNVLLLNFDNSEIDKVKRIVQSKIGDKKITVVNYDTSYLQTFKNILSKMPESPKEHYMWFCSSICDYTGFDFTYICDPYAREQLHVFPSDYQKYGDTFLVNINKLRELINDMEVLEDYDKVNFNEHLRVKRLPPPQYVTTEDTHTESIKKFNFDFPYAVLTTYDNQHLAEHIDKEPISLWQLDHKVVLSTSTGSSRIIIPKEAKNIIKREFYDYPYIKTANKTLNSVSLDIVFLSNGEACADSNYEYLVDCLKGKPNKLTRVDGVNGRVEAYHACANNSNTPWFFTVFAKLLVNPEFDWNWQPDRLQVPKHYIFNATNPVNGLCYGHQAMIAYNKRLVLNNRGRGLDFTLDDLHESVDIDSGTAMFNTDEFSTWRTSFREAIKLKVDVEYNNSEIAKERLDTWMNIAEGEYAEWSKHGAVDGVNYFEEVDGDVFELRESYEWSWCKDRFTTLYK